MIAEDGEGSQHLVGATADGWTYPIARADGGEFTGPVYSADGAVLFANVQVPAPSTRSPARWRQDRPEPGVGHLAALDPRGRGEQRQLVAGPAHELHRHRAPGTRTGTTTAGSPARFQACVYGTREADSSVVDR